MAVTNSIDQERAMPGGSWSGLVLVFGAPDRVFAAQRSNPTPLLPLLCVAAAATAVNLFLVWRLGFERIIAGALNAAAMVDPRGVVENALQHKTQILLVQSLSTFLGSVITPAFFAFVVFLMLVMAGSETSLRTLLGVTAYTSFAVSTLKYAVIFLTGLALQNPDTFDFRNPIASNLQFFLNSDTWWMAFILRRVDLFAIAGVLLMVTGIRRACVPVSRVVASLSVGVPTLTYLLVAAWLARA